MWPSVYPSLLLLLLLVTPTWQVKTELFKTCAQSGFCHRNRHFAHQVASLPAYASRYAVSLYLVDESEGLISGVVLKVVNDTISVALPFRLQLLRDNNVRLVIDETRPNDVGVKINPKRYAGASTWAFKSDPLAGTFTRPVAISETELTFSYGEHYSARLQFAPFKLTLLNGTTAQLVLNERNFLNLEHWRPKPAEGEEDAHLTPEESSFDSFGDSFADSKQDTLPLGPESVALDVSMPGFGHVYGIPEHADDLSLKETVEGEPYRMYNVDIFEYDLDSRMAMYGSIPFMMAVKPGMAAGVFWVNSADTWVDIAKTRDVAGVADGVGSTHTHWISESGVIDVVLLLGPTPGAISRSYGALTGFAALPPVFALAYHQSRWNYNDEADVLGVVAHMDEHHIPCDVIWLDIEYTDRKQYFTWKKELFPNPVGMMQQMDRTGRQLVTIIDPHLKTDYEVSDFVEKHQLAVQTNNADGRAFHGHCWPGESVWIDTLSPEARNYWTTRFGNGTALGGAATNLHIWNDMNEPSVFSGPETTAPKDTVHYGSWEARSVHNLYGMSFHEATFAAMRERWGGQRRPFVLTRAYFAGSQRSAAMWTGDNMSQWSHLKASVPMILTSGVVGMPFAGADVGGFFGNPSKELLTRWYQAGIWYPFFRAHAHIDSRRREPWIAGAPYTAIMRDAVRMRYALLPTLYTAFHDAHTSGTPVMKPMFFETPLNPETYAIDDQFFIGNTGLLVKPITEEGATATQLYLPDDEVYYSYGNYTILQGKGHHQVEAPLALIPVFLRGGSVVARKDRYRRSAALMRYDPFTVVVALDARGHAAGKLYLDDGETYGYERNDWVQVRFTATASMVMAEVENAEAALPFVESLNEVWVEKLVLAGASVAGPTVQVTQGGRTWEAAVVVEAGCVVVRSPRVVINKPWTVVLK